MTISGVRSNLWAKQQSGLYSPKRRRFPLNGLVLYLPLGHPGLAGSTIISKDLNAHSCTVTGATWGYQGRTFDGTDDYINCGDGISLDITAALTLEIWVKTTSFAAAQHGLGRDDGTNRNYWLAPSNTNTGWAFIIMVGNVVKDIYASAGASTTDFLHIVGTYDGTTQNIYTNGAVDATPIAVSGAMDNDNVSLTIGARATLVDRDFAGTIGEVRIWNRALTAAEIQHIYNATKWRYV